MRWAVVEGLTAGRETASILEIGCGLGAFGARLARRGGYLGLEPDPTSFATALRHITPFGGEVRNASWLDLGPGRTYDLVCAFEVLEHLADDRAALASWRDLVTPGGHLVVSVPAWPQRFNAWDARVGHHRRYEPGATATLLTSAGFADPEVVVYGWPLGYALEAGRTWIAGRRAASHPVDAEESMPSRTAASGRLLQPSRLVGRLAQVGVRPFVALQRRRPDRGTGLVAIARRPPLRGAVSEPRLVALAAAGRAACRRHPLIIGMTALVVFLAAFIPAVTHFRHLNTQTDPVLLLAVLVVFPPLIVGVNAVEFTVVARVAGHRVPVREAVAVSIGGTIANLLPIPGSVVVRSAALTSAGRGVGPTLQAVATVGGAWVGITATVLGIAAAFHNGPVGAALTVIGLTATAACLVLLSRQVGDRRRARRLAAAVVGVEGATVAIDTVRLWLVLYAIGVHGTVLDAVALNAASVLTVAAGIFPAGLGLREALSAVFGAASGLPAAVSVTAAVVDRFVVMGGLGLISLGVGAWAGIRSRHAGGRHPGPAQAGSAEERSRP